MSFSSIPASVFVLCIVLNRLGSIVCTEDHTGSTFTAVLMENGIYGGSASMYLKIINHDNAPLSYKVSNLMGTTDITGSTPAMFGSFVSLTTASLMNGTEKSSKSIYINVENVPLPANLPAVYLVVNNIGASDSTMILPESVLGTVYYAITYCEIFGYCQIAIAHDSSSTTASLTIRLPSRSDINVIFENTPYASGADITTSLSNGDAIQIQCQCDLTGTYIESSNGKIAVFSGSYGAVVGVGGKFDFLLEQMLPVSRWGKEYIAYSTTLRNTGDFIRVISSQANTIVRISGYLTVKLSTAGEFIHRRIDSGNAVFIRADKPIMVVQFTLNKETNDGFNGDSSMFILQATDHYRSEYTFHTLSPSGNPYVTTFFPRNADGLLLDGVLLNNTETCCIATNIVPEESFVVGYKNVTAGRHTLTSTSNEHFGAYLIEEENGQVYSQIIGLFTSEATPSIKPMVPGDKIDNNNNMQVDENTGCTETDILSAMSQPISGTTDCGKVLGTSSNEGKLFMLVFPGRGESTPEIKLYVASASSFSFDYTKYPSGITTPVSGNEKIETNMDANLNNDLEIVNTGIHDRMIFIESSDNIVVHAHYASHQSAYSYLALPVNAFGLEYFAVTNFAGNNNTITITAAYNDTIVSIHLPFLANGEKVIFDGQHYESNEVITVTLAQRSSIHLRQTIDLTGTYIRASNPVAVFSGADDYLEQLFPTEYFGTVFVLPKLDATFTSNMYRIVASEGNTICQIYHTAGYTTFHNMSFIGEKWDQTMSGPDDMSTLSCRKAVQVTLFAKTTANGGFMANVVPSQQFKTSYHFTTKSNHHISIHRTSTNFYLKFSTNGAEIRRDRESRYIETTASSGIHYIELETKHNNESHSVYVFSDGVQSTTSTFAHGSLGGTRLWDLTKTCTPTANVVNDYLDNDCDGLVNEEICVRNIYKYDPDVYISNEKYIPDFDIDGSMDEDCYMEIPIPSSSTELTSSIEPTPSSYYSSTDAIESTAMTIQPTSSVYMSSSISTQPTTPQPSTSQLCACPCSKTVVDPKYQNLTKEKIDRIVEEIRKELTVEKGNLSSSIRKKISAKDNRPSSTGIGSVGIVFFVIVFGGLILSDVSAIYHHLIILKNNIRGFR